MKELEQIIIGSCFGEDQYKKVSFLEPEDFTNYPNKPFREYFKLLKKTKAESNYLVECLSVCNDKNVYLILCQQNNLLGANNIDRFAIKLLEVRFKTLLIDLLTKLSYNSKNALEAELLNASLMSIPRVDIFDLSDNIIEYLGVHIAANTRNRIESFIKYRNDRVQKAKEVINES